MQMKDMMRRVNQLKWLGWTLFGLAIFFGLPAVTFFPTDRWARQEVQRALELRMPEAKILENAVHKTSGLTIVASMFMAASGLALVYEVGKLKAAILSGQTTGEETRHDAARPTAWSRGAIAVVVCVVVLGSVAAWEGGQILSLMARLSVWSKAAGASRAAELLAKGRPVWLQPTPDTSRHLEVVGVSNGLPVKLWPCLSLWDEQFVAAFNGRIAQSMTNEVNP